MEEVIEDSPEGIWSACHEDLILSEDDFLRYFEGSASAVAIEISNMTRFPESLDPHSLMEDFRPPQSFCYTSMDLHQE